MEILEQIKKAKLVPVTVFKSIDDVDTILSSLIKGGIYTTEICFRTDCALEAIKIATNKYKEMLVGAGTVITEKQAIDAIDAGAKFIVSPGFSDSVCKVCKEKNILYIPGVITPTEVIHALDNGLTYLKFFPANVFGGIKAINNICAAFPNVSFMVTGGVDNSNLKEYLECKHLFAIGGSWLLKGDIVNNCLEANRILKGE